MTNPLSDVVDRLRNAASICRSAFLRPSEKDARAIDDGITTIERLSAERLQLREALEMARPYVLDHSDVVLSSRIDAALSNTAEDTRHD
jgi:hypothetical protein